MDFDKKNKKESKNFIDLTGVTSAMHERVNMVRNFLMAQILNQRSLPNQKYYSGLGELPPGKDFPFRPVENSKGNVIEDLLTNPDYVKDERYSSPNPLTSPFFKMMIDEQRKRLMKNKKGSSSGAY